MAFLIDIESPQVVRRLVMSQKAGHTRTSSLTRFGNVKFLAQDTGNNLLRGCDDRISSFLSTIVITNLAEAPLNKTLSLLPFDRDVDRIDWSGRRGCGRGFWELYSKASRRFRSAVCR